MRWTAVKSEHCYSVAEESYAAGWYLLCSVSDLKKGSLNRSFLGEELYVGMTKERHPRVISFGAAGRIVKRWPSAIKNNLIFGWYGAINKKLSLPCFIKDDERCGDWVFRSRDIRRETDFTLERIVENFYRNCVVEIVEFETYPKKLSGNSASNFMLASARCTLGSLMVYIDLAVAAVPISKTLKRLNIGFRAKHCESRSVCDRQIIDGCIANILFDGISESNFLRR